MTPDSGRDPVWTFLTNHARALVCIAEHPDARLRDIAAAIGVTERAAQRIVGDLADAGYLSRLRVGRRNTYTVHADQPLHAGSADGGTVGLLLRGLGCRFVGTREERA